MESDIVFRPKQAIGLSHKRRMATNDAEIHLLRSQHDTNSFRLKIFSTKSIAPDDDGHDLFFKLS